MNPSNPTAAGKPESPSLAQHIADVIGRQIKIIGDHPWAGHRARVLDIDKIGMKVAIMRNDAMDGHEAYIMKRSHFVAIPRNLETEF